MMLSFSVIVYKVGKWRKSSVQIFKLCSVVQPLMQPYYFLEVMSKYMRYLMYAVYVMLLLY